jgi:DNA-binding beta-propeller fold protein YncE
MRKALFFFLTLFTFQLQAQTKLTKLWETKDLPTPESVLPYGNWLYVSLIDGGASEVDFKGGIALLSQSGMVVNKEWIKGLNAPKGMGIYKDIMYVADINRVIKIDVKTARILARINIDGSVFLNDVAIDNKGNVFVSDTRLNNIYKIADDKPELYLENVASANGLKVIKNDLFILSGPQLLKVDANKNITTIAKGLEAGGDGLEPLDKNTFLASCWAGLVYTIGLDGKVTKLIDCRGEKINTADIGYNPKLKVMYLPTFLKNSVVAYKVE